jgi:hypothetical protein
MRRYFAYGSNMCSARLFERVPGAAAVGPAQLPDHDLVLNKPGVDGSAKANVVPRPRRSVWGVVYAIDEVDFARLDRYEVGYRRQALRVIAADESALVAEVYIAVQPTGDGVPFDWYKGLMLDGAREHGLPRSYLDQLVGLPERFDPKRVGERGS